MNESDDVDTSNMFFVGRRGDRYVFLRAVPREISQVEAYNLAAYLVAMGDDDEAWKRIFQAVRNT